AYLTAIFEGKYDEAYRINLEHNVFPAVLGRVCARPCEEECRHGWEGLGESVAICWSKRSAADHLSQRDPVKVRPYFETSTGKTIVVIGAGVAGLTAARELKRMGHEVKVLERYHEAGGIMVQGIPQFRLPREVVRKEIAQIEALGVEIRCNVEVGRDVTLQELLAGHDAVIIAAGTFRENILELPGAELPGILHGLTYLRRVHSGETIDLGHDVVVIGGGFTAMDCARTAWRYGADNVKVFYRRSANEMLITPGELEELEKEGIPMEFLVSPVAYIGDDQGRLQAVRFIRNQLGEPDASGRRRPEPVPGSEFEVPASAVLLATGQFPQTDWIDPQLRSHLVAPDQWPQTPSPRQVPIFHVGDFATGASSLINAIGHAKEMAVKIDAWLMGETRLHPAALIEDAESTGRIREMDFVPRQEMPALDVSQRRNQNEVELGYTRELAVEETQRCYRCHYKFEIDNTRCIYCDWCIKAKPRPECILKIRTLQHDAEGRITGWEIAEQSEDVNLIFINQNDCIRCGACVDACPVDCISLQKVSYIPQCDLHQLKAAVSGREH
ncbi:MAG: FAD-dependent oxidoreductase, partial [Lentisphaerae bacterium]